MTAPSLPADGSRTRITGVSPRPRPEVEVGVSNHLPFITPYKNAWEVLRDDEVTVKQLVAMRRTDGQARALYRLITLPIRAALKTATFVPEEGVEGGEEEAAFIQQMFTLPASGGGMTVPFGRVIAQMLMALFDGFSAFECVYWSPKSGPLKGKWTLKKAAHRPSDSLTFVIDDNGEFAGLRQQTMWQNRQVDVVIAAEHSFYYAANEEERPWYGQSYFQSAFYHWDKKYKLYVVAHLAAQRAAVGTRVGTLPANPTKEEKREFQRSLADLGFAQWMTVPPDYKVESLKEFTGFDFLAYINHHNNQMSKSVLAAFFDEQQGSGGDASLVDFGRQSDALFMLMLQTIMREVEEVINTQVIPKFIDWNFGTGKYPKFQFGSLSQEQKNTLVELFKTLSVAGQSLTITPEFLHELEKQIAEEFGLEIDWEAVEARLAQEAAQQQMQGQLDMIGSPGPGGASGQAGAAPAAGSAQVDPQMLPEGFVLSAEGVDTLTLSDLAAELLDEAIVELVRGKPRSGGPKVVRTPAGARVYGEPIGTPISRDMDRGLGSFGPQGAPFGSARGKNPVGNRAGGQADPTTARGGGKGAPAQEPSERHGGGRGAAPQNPGNVVTDPANPPPRVQRVLTNPRQPGVQLLDFGDGTVAVRDAKGRLSPRQRFPVSAFARLGWQVQTGAAADGGNTVPDGGNTDQGAGK